MFHFGFISFSLCDDTRRPTHDRMIIVARGSWLELITRNRWRMWLHQCIISHFTLIMASITLLYTAVQQLFSSIPMVCRTRSLRVRGRQLYISTRGKYSYEVRVRVHTYHTWYLICYLICCEKEREQSKKITARKSISPKLPIRTST